jgi:predicted Zn finger-like uncharacterized protein
MRIRDVTCPRCGAHHIVDSGLFDIGTVRVRCPECSHYFHPSGSPATRTVEDVTNANVTISIWEPEE